MLNQYIKQSTSRKATLLPIPVMRAISPIHIGPAQDMVMGMGSDMATDRAIGEIRSDTMGPPTDPLVWGGIVDMVGLAERNGHRVCQGRVLCRHLMLRRSSEKSTEIPSSSQFLSDRFSPVSAHSTEAKSPPVHGNIFPPV